jgi:beta-glucosidase
MAGTGGERSTDGKEMKRIPDTNVQSDDSPEFASILPWLKPGIHNLYEELTTRLPDTEILTAKGYEIFGADEAHFEEALALIENADLVLLTLGGKNGSGSVATMGEGVDGTDINLPAGQDAFIRKAAKLGKPMVGIHLDGRPISSDTADEYLNAILECWSPSECGAQAIVDALTGEINPSGKLPVTVARSAGQLPIWYNHYNGSQWHQGKSIGFQDYVDMPHTPRYPFGYGLSYTTFEYSNLKLDSKEIASDGKVIISTEVKNTGKVFGTEIVQLYVSDEYASRIRPVQELAGFVRVTLNPGETKTISFTLCASQLAFYLAPHQWLVEKGKVEVCIGASSEDIHLKDTIQITDSIVIDGKDRALWAKANIQ